MTYSYEHFMKDVQEYFGSYREGTNAGRYVLAYLKKDIDEQHLKKLFRAVCYYCRLSDYAPGISDIEYAIKKASGEDKGNIYHKTRENGTAERIKAHKQEIESLPESERIEIGNEGDLFRKLIKQDGDCQIKSIGG